MERHTDKRKLQLEQTTSYDFIKRKIRVIDESDQLKINI